MRFLFSFLLAFGLGFGAFAENTQNSATAPVDVIYHESIHQVDVNDFGNLSPITSVGEVMQKLLNIMMTLLGSLALLGMIVGGVMMMGEGINDGQAKKGKQIVLYSAIGVVVAISSLIIVTLAQTIFYYFGT